MQPVSDALLKLENVVEEGLAGFMKVGAALLAIRDSGLYHQRGHERFEDYCEARFHFSRQRAYQLMQAADAALTVSSMLDTPPPANARQAEELSRLHDPELICEAWAEVREEHPDKVTAANVREVVDRKLGVQRQARPERQQMREQAQAEQAEGQRLLQAAGVMDAPEVQRSAARLRVIKVLAGTRNNLLLLEPAAVAAALDHEDVDSWRWFIRDCRKWLDGLEAALTHDGLRVIEGGRG